jgi:hypothetical protein
MASDLHIRRKWQLLDNPNKNEEGANGSSNERQILKRKRRLHQTTSETVLCIRYQGHTILELVTKAQLDGATSSMANLHQHGDKQLCATTMTNNRDASATQHCGQAKPLTKCGL